MDEDKTVGTAGNAETARSEGTARTEEMAGAEETAGTEETAGMEETAGTEETEDRGSWDRGRIDLVGGNFLRVSPPLNFIQKLKLSLN